MWKMVHLPEQIYFLSINSNNWEVDVRLAHATLDRGATGLGR
jgi:hypothetical protein